MRWMTWRAKSAWPNLGTHVAERIGPHWTPAPATAAEAPVAPVAHRGGRVVAGRRLLAGPQHILQPVSTMLSLEVVHFEHTVRMISNIQVQFQLNLSIFEILRLVNLVSRARAQL
jgi:hypothetical protein